MIFINQPTLKTSLGEVFITQNMYKQDLITDLKKISKINLTYATSKMKISSYAMLEAAPSKFGFRCPL